MGVIQLRDYQEDAIIMAEGHMARTEKFSAPQPAILQLPTAAGKSFIIAELARRTKGNILILSPTKEIALQNYEKLLLVGLNKKDVKVCSASLNSWEIGKITIATIGTIGKRHNLVPDLELVIIDEAHLVPCDNGRSQYIQFFNKITAKHFIGMTATPWRNVSFQKITEPKPRIYCRPLPRIFMKNGDTTRFGKFFWKGGIIYRLTIADLQARGNLASTNYMVQQTDWSFVKECPGRVDYDPENLARWTEFESNNSMISRALSYARDNNWKTLIFCPDVSMAHRLCAIGENLGIKATTLDSTNDNKKTREAKLKAFKDGRIDMIFNVAILTTGYDLPSLDCVLVCRPTKSLGLYIQILGRALRVDPNNPTKKAQIIDLSGNCDRFGMVEDIKIEKLQNKKTKKITESIVVRPLSAGKFKILDRIS